jgi:hypothetical protein
MRTIKILTDSNPTITKEEYLLLKESLRDSFEPYETSTLNKSMTKQQAFNVLFNDKIKIDDRLEYLHFFNIVREFVVKKKTFSNWKILQNYKPVKEIKEIRKEKINKIENS